jgi:hypothetical protein
MAVNITYEKSALASFLEDLPGMMLQYQMTMTGWERQDREAAKDRIFRKEMMKNEADLNLLASDYQFQRQRLATLEDELSVAGYQLPEESKTSSFGEVKDRTVGGYKSALQDTLTSIEQVNKEKALIQAGRDFAKTQEDLYGGLVTAGEDEAWKDFMLEGNIEYHPSQPEGQQFTGTEEMANWLNKLSLRELDQLKNYNFRQAFIRGRRGLEEANKLNAERSGIALNNVQILGAGKKIIEGDYDLGMKIFADVERDYDNRMFQAGLEVLSSLNMVTADGQYSINYLQMLEDPDEYIEIMEDFIEANPEIATEIISIKDRFILAKQEGVDWSESVLRAQANAYSDFLEANQIELTMGDGDKDVGVEKIKQLPLNDKTRMKYDLLKKRVNQFKRAGLYGGGQSPQEIEARLTRSYELIEAKDKLFQDRIEADMEYLSLIAKEGYPVELSDFTPNITDDITAEQAEEMQISLSLLASMKKTGEGGADPIDAGKLIETLTKKLGTLEAAGLTGLDQYWELVRQLQTTEIDLNKFVNKQRVKEATDKIDKMLDDASEMTGIPKDILIEEHKRVQSQQIPWSEQGRRRTSAGKLF